jgi:hypothetical protein
MDMTRAECASGGQLLSPNLAIKSGIDIILMVLWQSAHHPLTPRLRQFSLENVAPSCFSLAYSGIYGAKGTALQ